jgi:hypothetical protein
MHFEGKIRAQDVLADIPGRVRFLQRLLELLVHLPDLAVDVVVARRRTHRVAGDDHSLDHRMRVVAQQVAVLARAGLAFVRVAHDVLRAGELLGHERPLQPGGKARAPAPAQRGLLELGDQIFGFQFFLQDPL